MRKEGAISKRRSLLLSIRCKVHVKFTRPFEEGSVSGYVIDSGPKFFLVATIDRSLRLDGFECFRLQDMRGLQIASPHYQKFIKAVLRKRKQRIPKNLGVTMSSLAELLRTAGRIFPVITIHRERTNPAVCHVGRVEEVTGNRLSLLEIGPDATWDAQPTSYRLSEITQVNFGGGYEEALLLVGGIP